MSLPIEKIRQDFPILQRKINNKPLIYLDNAATTQTPQSVVTAIEEMYNFHKANVHRGVHSLSQEATSAMEATRRKVCKFINAKNECEIIFTRGTTESINLIAFSYGELLKAGDEIIISAMEHHSNIVPWQLLAQRRGIILRVIPLNDNGTLDLEAFRKLISPRTKLVSVCHASNVLGTINPISELTQIAHNNGALISVDGAQAIAHQHIDVQALDVDFYSFSAHKMYGPTGVGILYAKEELLQKMPPYQGGGEMIGHVSFSVTTWADLPYKFEAGTPDFVGIAAFAHTIDYLEQYDLNAIRKHEQDLLEYATQGIQQIEGIRLFGTAPEKTAVLSFLIGNSHHYDTGVLLDHLGIAVRTGHHCAQPLMEYYGIEGTVRASFAMYNTFEEVDTFIAGLKRVALMLA